LKIKSEKEIKTEILIETFKEFDINFNEYIAQVEKNAEKYNLLLK